MATIPEAERRHLAALYDKRSRPRTDSQSSSSGSHSSRESSETRQQLQYKQIRKQSSPAYLSAGSYHNGSTTTKSTPSPVRSTGSSSNDGSSTTSYRHNRSQSVKIPSNRHRERTRRQFKPSPLNLDLSSFNFDNHGHDSKGHTEDSGVYRLRNFQVTSRGDVVNRGDSYRARSVSSLNTPVHQGSFHMDFPRNERLSVSSAYSTGQETSLSGETTYSQNPHHKVLMSGAAGVGKTALTNQFLTSEYMNAYDTSLTDDETENVSEKSVSVLLDGVESELDFIDPDPTTLYLEERLWESSPVDAHVVVYSVTDRSSFEKAIDILFELKQSEITKHHAIILVGNKSDLVRARIVAKDEGKSIASSYDCKFIETSAGLNHNVDELLVGILTQIRSNGSNGFKWFFDQNIHQHGKVYVRWSGAHGVSCGSKKSALAKFKNRRIVSMPFSIFRSTSWKVVLRVKIRSTLTDTCGNVRCLYHWNS